MSKSEMLHSRLAEVSAQGTPALRGFAGWALDNLSLIAFGSIRGLAGQAGVNPNTVTRLARELGYPGFDAFRADVRQLIQATAPTYGERARALRNRPGSDVFLDIIDSSRENSETVFSPDFLDRLDACIGPLLAARRVYTVGVRSCYSIAHYFSYVGGLAFPHLVAVPTIPGGIADQISQATPEDIVVGITYDHYSAEVVLACENARARGARVLALTDSHTSPIAVGAWKVLRLPMAGPQFMPSLNSAFLIVEMLLVGMVARSGGAADRVTAFEDRIRAFGGYT